VLGFLFFLIFKFPGWLHCQEACFRSLSLSLFLFLARGILSQLWLRCYMNTKLMSFHVCFGGFFFFILSLSPSLPPSLPAYEYDEGIQKRCASVVSVFASSSL
jgi:hypothetical protein